VWQVPPRAIYYPARGGEPVRFGVKRELVMVDELGGSESQPISDITIASLVFLAGIAVLVLFGKDLVKVYPHIEIKNLTLTPDFSSLDLL